MDERTAHRPARREDAGFTLIEMLIVMVTIGIIATAVSTVVVVTLRTSPAADVRIDDARSVQGLVTWLPQDIDAAPPSGFNRDTSYWPCAGSAPANSYNVLTAEWTERTSADYDFAASYRYESSGGDWTMVRYACDNGGAGPMGPAGKVNLTSALPPWNNLAPPAKVEMCKAAISAGGTCPAGEIIPAGDTSPSEVLSMKLLITRLDGEIATIDAAPKNPDQDLSDDPNASTNHKPTLSQTNYVLKMFAGQTVTIDLATTHNASDPDGDPISGAIDSTEPIPAGITAVTSDPLNVTVTAAAGLSSGVKNPPIVVIVSDNKAGWVDATVTVEILPQPNLPPVVSAFNYLLKMQAGQTVIVPLDSTHGVVDPNGDPLTVTVLSHPNSIINPPVTNSPGPLDLRVKAQPSAPLGPVGIPISLSISDGKGGFVLVTITIEIVSTTVNQPPTASPTNIDVDLYAGDSLPLALNTSHGVYDPDGDAISIVSSSAPANATTTLGGGLNATININAGAPVGPLAGPVSFVVQDTSGASVTVTVTVTILPTPPPPSDCVLTGLSATPSSVERQGGGTQAHLLKNDVTVTVTYTGSCDGLALFYDTGDTSGLGIGTGRIFPPNSPASVVIVSRNNGGTEKWTPGSHTLTVRTTSDVTPNSRTTSLTVT